MSQKNEIYIKSLQYLCYNCSSDKFDVELEDETYKIKCKRCNNETKHPKNDNILIRKV